MRRRGPAAGRSSNSQHSSKFTLNEAGFDIKELFGKRGSSKGSGVAKYRNPKDSSQTWTGRGRKPNWLVDAVKKGAKLENFKI
jgi:DNA-binding protein H-NS